MVLVKIIRESIKKNPDAGKTYTRLHIGNETSFEVKGKVPELLMNEEVAIITEWEEKEDGVYNAKGFIEDPDSVQEILSTLQKESSKDYSVSINTKSNYQEIPHNPLPKYLYKYENPEIECSECKSKVFYSDIERDCDDEYGCYDVCPVCQAHDSFDFDLENINDVKELPK
jgi:hypothetical protein